MSRLVFPRRDFFSNLRRKRRSTFFLERFSIICVNNDKVISTDGTEIASVEGDRSVEKLDPMAFLLRIERISHCRWTIIRPRSESLCHALDRLSEDS